MQTCAQKKMAPRRGDEAPEGRAAPGGGEARQVAIRGEPDSDETLVARGPSGCSPGNKPRFLANTEHRGPANRPGYTRLEESNYSVSSSFTLAASWGSVKGFGRNA